MAKAPKDEDVVMPLDEEEYSEEDDEGTDQSDVTDEETGDEEDNVDDEEEDASDEDDAGAAEDEEEVGSDEEEVDSSNKARNDQREAQNGTSKVKPEKAESSVTAADEARESAINGVGPVVLKPVTVTKVVEPYMDLGNLLLIDRDPDDTSSEDKSKKPQKSPGHKRPSEDDLLARARDNTQALFNKIWELPRHVVQEAICAELPPPEFELPREKPIPKPREPTKWEKFSREKGIGQNKNKSRKVWDDATESWKPTYGYRRANDDTKDWLIEIPDNKDPNVDYFEQRNQAKKERVAKNEFQRLRNVARTQKGGGQRWDSNNPNNIPLGVGVGSEARSRHELTHQLHRAKHATASVGKFQDGLKGERTPKLGKKRQFAPNEGNTKSERDHQMEILKRMESKKPRIAESRINAAAVSKERSENGDSRGKSDKKKKQVVGKSQAHRQKMFKKIKKGQFAPKGKAAKRAGGKAH
ncbi:Protein RRBS-1 [Aphelenchoides avenae]|nr:Protein RRBS-1 [Aphelenchus avenae]